MSKTEKFYCLFTFLTFLQIHCSLWFRMRLNTSYVSTAEENYYRPNRWTHTIKHFVTTTIIIITTTTTFSFAPKSHIYLKWYLQFFRSHIQKIFSSITLLKFWGTLSGLSFKMQGSSSVSLY